MQGASHSNFHLGLPDLQICKLQRSSFNQKIEKTTVLGVRDQKML